MERSKITNKISAQIKEKQASTQPDKKTYDGDFGTIISTGSTLLDLNISGGRVRGGGLPGGILVEAFGPSGSGKTVLLSEVAGNVQRLGGAVKFDDPEGRLNKQFALMFGLEIDEENYKQPDTVTEVFQSIRKWEPKNKKIVNGIFTDSLAALSTDMEMENDEGDKMGGRRAKEFSEQLRKTCRLLAEKNYLMMCSNQIRQNMGATQWEPKYTTPGGMAMEFYASLRLKFTKPEKIIEKRTIAGKEVKRIVGIDVTIEVAKSSIWKPYRSAPVTILFDYGIDNIRQNLQFIKDYTKNTVYTLGGQSLDKGIKESISIIEEDRLEKELKEEVIDLWEDIESKFKSERKPKR